MRDFNYSGTSFSKNIRGKERKRNLTFQEKKKKDTKHGVKMETEDYNYDRFSF